MKHTKDNPGTQQAEEDFLQRWSRRKRMARKDPQTVETEPVQVPKDVLPLPTDADMPPLESLNEDSDYSGFLSPKVSEHLRRQALRKLFHSPVFNVRDGLDDYDEEFTHFAGLGETVTSDMRHRLEEEAARLRKDVIRSKATQAESDPATVHKDTAASTQANDQTGEDEKDPEAAS